MIRIQKILTSTLALAMAFGVLTTACVDFSYDDIEPRTDTTDLKANTTIAELKAVYAGKIVQLTKNTFDQRDTIIIVGKVTSDDKDGNFYKSLFIEDATGAIEIKVSKTSLYNDYKRGQKIAVICNDLYLGDYGGQIQLGSIYSNNGVTEIGGLEGDPIISRHIFMASRTIEQEAPLLFTPAQQVPANIGRLVLIENVQIKDTLSPITGKTFTYADSENHITYNHELLVYMQTFSNPLVLRTSGYAKFAANTIPTKRGTLTGILTYYNGTYQLIIRDTSDVKFNQDRFQQ